MIVWTLRSVFTLGKKETCIFINFLSIIIVVIIYKE